MPKRLDDMKGYQHLEYQRALRYMKRHQLRKFKDLRAFFSPYLLLPSPKLPGVTKRQVTDLLKKDGYQVGVSVPSWIHWVRWCKESAITPRPCTNHCNCSHKSVPHFYYDDSDKHHSIVSLLP